MRKQRRVALAAVAGLTALALSACANNAQPASSADPNVITLVNPEKLTVCTHLAFKPFEFTDGGKIVGFDVDLLDLVAKDLGVTTEIVDLEFGQITSGAVFVAKKCDVGGAGTTITEERKKAATFSQPYFDSKLALLVKSDSSVTKLEDLKGKVLGVQTDTTGMKYGEENKEKYGYTTKVFDDLPTTSNAVLAGTVDGSINDNGVLLDFAKDNPGTKVVQEYVTGDQFGFNVGNDNKALAARIDAVLAKAKSDGTFNQIYKKWFGVDAPK